MKHNNKANTPPPSDDTPPSRESTANSCDTGACVCVCVTKSPPKKKDSRADGRSKHPIDTSTCDAQTYSSSPTRRGGRPAVSP